MYMNRTLPRVGCKQNVYKLLLDKCTQNEFIVQVYTKLFKRVGTSLNKLKVDNWKMKGEIQFWGQTNNQTNKYT